MKIGVISSSPDMTEAAMSERRNFLMQSARPDTDIQFFKCHDGPLSIESEAEREEASVNLVKRMLELEPQGFDAFVPWCAGDPAIVSGRERLRTPIIGPLQAACAFANLLGFRFSVLTPMTNPRLVRQRVTAAGFAGTLASVRLLNIPVLELRQDMEKTRSVVIDAIGAIAREDGADAVVMACMGLFGLADDLKASVPVIDPARAAIAMAEGVIALGQCHSRIAYPFPKEG